MLILLIAFDDEPVAVDGVKRDISLSRSTRSIEAILHAVECDVVKYPISRLVNLKELIFEFDTSAIEYCDDPHPITDFVFHYLTNLAFSLNSSSVRVLSIPPLMFSV